MFCFFVCLWPKFNIALDKWNWGGVIQMLTGLGTGSARKNKAGPLQIFVYDTRRGNREGHEEEKILSFYPLSTPSDDQLVAVGLSQALTTFVSTFDENLENQNLITDNRKWCSSKFEVGIWIGAVVDCGWGPGKTGRSSLRVLLREVYGWIKLLHGSVNRMLVEDPSVGDVRGKLQVILDTWGGLLTGHKSPMLKALENPLGVARFGALPFLPLPRDALLALQYVSNILQDDLPVVGMVFCHDLYVIWSTLDLEATKLIYSFACRSSIMGGGKSFGTDARRVRLELGGEDSELWLLPIQLGSLTSMVLLEGSVDEPKLFHEPLRDVISDRSDVVSKGASHQLSSLDSFHISGYRYVYLDMDSDFGCASPEKKVGDLSKKTVQMLQQVQDVFGVGEGDQGDYEVIVRGEHKGWVVVREGGSRALCVALDQLQDASMEQIGDHIAKLSDTNFPGAFNM